MFTVMHRNEFGDELVIAASRVEKVNQREGENAGDWMSGVAIYGEDGEMVRHCPFISNDPEKKMAVVPYIFVMNEAGATVATYRL